MKGAIRVTQNYAGKRPDGSHAIHHSRVSNPMKATSATTTVLRHPLKATVPMSKLSQRKPRVA